MKYMVIMFIGFSLIGCQKKDRFIPLTESMSSLPNVVKPNFGIANIVEEHFGILDSAGFVTLNSTGVVKAFIYDVETWFRIPINREIDAPYVLLNGSIAQYTNFHGTKYYYLVVCSQ